MYGVKRKSLEPFFLPRSKVELLNSAMHQFSYSGRTIHFKMNLKRSLCIEFKENALSHFSLGESLQKLKIGMPNLEFQ